MTDAVAVIPALITAETDAVAVFRWAIAADSEAVEVFDTRIAAATLALAERGAWIAAAMFAVAVFGVDPAATYGTSNSAHVTLTLTEGAAASGSNHPPGVPVSSNQPCGTNSLSNVPLRAMDYQQ